MWNREFQSSLGALKEGQSYVYDNVVIKNISSDEELDRM